MGWLFGFGRYEFKPGCYCCEVIWFVFNKVLCSKHWNSRRLRLNVLTNMSSM